MGQNNQKSSFRTCIHSQRKMDFCSSWYECQAKFHADSVPISVKFNAAGVLNGAKRHRAWLLNTGS